MTSAQIFIKEWAREPFYPIFFALYPALFIYYSNIKETTINDVVFPLLISLVGVLVVFLTSRLLYASWSKAAFWTFVLSVTFFSYSVFANLLPDSIVTVGKTVIGGNKILFPVFVVLLLVFGWWWRRSTFSGMKLVSLLNIVTLGLVLFCLVQIAPTEMSRLQSIAQASGSTTQAAQATVANGPDVYYLIFDRYGGPEGLEQGYGFDDSSFLSWLKDQGFYVANNSLTNYMKTSFSLSSTFNMDYHTTYNSDDGYPTEATDIYPLFKNTKVEQQFHALGYKTYALNSWFTQTAPPEGFDKVYRYQAYDWLPNRGLSTELLQTTMAMPVVSFFMGDNLADPVVHHLVYTRYELQHYQEVYSLPGPKFVFAHILLPHPPMIYDANCQDIVGKSTTKTYDQQYIDQLQCANKVAEEMVATIKADTNGKAIIIVQSDEGATSTASATAYGDNNVVTASDSAMIERANILNSYYFPDGNYQNLYNSISPVNTFRTVFNQYFGQHYDLLPNRTYAFKDMKHQFDYLDVTDRMIDQLTHIKFRGGDGAASGSGSMEED